MRFVLQGRAMSVIQVEEKKVKVGKVLCVGRNYVEHIQELNNAMPEQMVVFNKHKTFLCLK